MFGQFNSLVQIIQFDNVNEFKMNFFYSLKCVVHQTSCVETSQQNGIVEHKHQHILNVTRTLMFQAHLPKVFWSFAMGRATYIINRLPTPLLDNKSPFELLHNHSPDFSNLRVFGSPCYSTTLTAHRSKFDPRAQKVVFLGFSPSTKGFFMI